MNAEPCLRRVSPCSEASNAWNLLLFALFILLASSAAAAPRLRADRILIQPKAANLMALERLHAAERIKVLRRFPALGNIEILELPSGASVEASVARYRQSGLVEHAEPDRRIAAAAIPDDPSYLDGTQWNLNNVGQAGGALDADVDAPEGWDTYRSPTNLIVAVIDSGARLSHEDLATNLWSNPGEIPGNGFDDDFNGVMDDVHGINALANSGNPFDDTGHGTHVAGILGASGNNGRGIAGVCWQVRLMICKFLDAEGGLESDLIQCLDYARANGARVLNCSFVTPDFSFILSNAFWSVRNAGIIVVAAAGNSGTDNDVAPQYPSSYRMDNIVSVTATTRTDGFAGYNYGAASVHLAAPGLQIYSTFNTSDTGYAMLSGTSMAAPHISGAAALLMARFPATHYRQIIDRLLVTVDPLPGLAGRCSTGGRLNLARALGPSLQADFIPSTPLGLLPLTVTFTNTSFGAITNHSWNFGDGSAPVSSENALHLFANAGEFNVTLTVTGTNGATSTTNQIVRVIRNYVIEDGLFDWVPTNGMAPIALGGNGVSGPHPIPFFFPFYGQQYTQLFFSANGLVGFTNDLLWLSVNADLPGTAAPNAILCPYWDDLNPAGGGGVWFGVRGAAPNRQAVISWVDVPHANTMGGETYFAFQAVLHESGVVAFQYLRVEQGRNTLVSGKSATIGAEDGSGMFAAKYGFNGDLALVSNNQALLLKPEGWEESAPVLASPKVSLGRLTFDLFAAPGQRCVIESSADWTDWTPVATNLVPSSGRGIFVEPGPTNQLQRFFRARSEP